MMPTRSATISRAVPVAEDRLLHLFDRGIAGCRERDARQVREVLMELIGALNFGYEEAAARLFGVYDDCLARVRNRQFEIPLLILERLERTWAPVRHT
jgi:hypothetical protein